MSTYYSASSFLAYCLNRYFYDDTHYVYGATEFYPYRLPNPKSSNPLETYRDFYQPWKDADPYDKFIAQHRVNLRKGVMAQQKKGTITITEAKKLKKICDKVAIIFFYPIVYRIDTSRIDPKRIKTAGSGMVGSSEILIEDLSYSKNEFDIVFLDFSRDSDLNSLKSGAVGDANFALPILERRC